MPSEGIEGRSSQGGGRGRSDRPQIRDPSRGSQIYVVKILGNFTHSQNEENWIDFWVWETDFGSPGGHF